MANVFLTNKQGDILALDCTQTVNKVRSNSLSESSVMSGANISDGYTIGNRMISLSGLVTYNKIGGLSENTFDPLEFQVELDRLVEDHTRFTFYGNELIPSVKNCVILSDEVIMDNFADTIRVNLSLKEVFVSEAATKDIIIVTPTKEAEEEIPNSTDTGNGVKFKFDAFKAPAGAFESFL